MENCTTGCRQDATSCLESIISIKELELQDMKEFLSWLRINVPTDGAVESILYQTINHGFNKRF
jgi:hypothetical protein